MTDDQKLQKLILYLENHEIPVKTDRGNFRGGIVRYHDEQIMYLNRRLDTSAKIRIITSEFEQLLKDENKQPDTEFKQLLKEIV